MPTMITIAQTLLSVYMNLIQSTQFFWPHESIFRCSSSAPSTSRPRRNHSHGQVSGRQQTRNYNVAHQSYDLDIELR